MNVHHLWPLALALSLAACQEQAPTPPIDVPAPAPNITSAPQPSPVKNAPLLTEQITHTDRGDSDTRRDPFTYIPEAPPLLDPEAVGPSLRAMELIGIVTGTPTPTAMFIDKAGFGHMLSEGARVAEGRVSDIRDNEVEVTLSSAPQFTASEDVESDAPRNNPDVLVFRLTQAPEFAAR